MLKGTKDDCYYLKDELGIEVNKVFEVGVCRPNVSQTTMYIDDGVDVTLIEPIPYICKQLIDAFGSKPNVTIHNVAIGDFNGMGKFSIPSGGRLEGVSWLLGHDIVSPFEACGHLATNNPTIIDVPVRKISEFDTGDIDLVTMDMEGGEWYVMKHLVSRPKAIMTEWTNPDGKYLNPFADEMLAWAAENGYREWGMSYIDKIFVREDIL